MRKRVVLDRTNASKVVEGDGAVQESGRTYD